MLWPMVGPAFSTIADLALLLIPPKGKATAVIAEHCHGYGSTSGESCFLPALPAAAAVDMLFVCVQSVFKP